MLYGREPECEQIELVVARAREGRAGSLVIRGEPGIGKTALLDHAAEVAGDAKVIRIGGVQSETELAFAGLHALLQPVAEGLNGLPPPQADAVRGALGLAEPDPPSRFLLSLGAIGLLSAASETTPLVCLIDDAQWVDQASLEAFVFTARRLDADRVGILFSTRAEGEHITDALPAIRLGPLDRAAAARLLDGRLGPPLSRDERRQVLTVAAGNPLALMELGRSASQGGVTASPAGGLPLSSTLERAFLGRVGTLTPHGQRMLLLAAADDSGELGPLLDAAGSVGMDSRALTEAEQARLVRVIDGELRFAHPLVRSGVYQAAKLVDRQAAHRALADAFARYPDADRCAWHIAAAAVFPDDQAAAELEAAALRARDRGAFGAGASALERAAGLTPDPARRVERLLEASRMTLKAGRADHAIALTEDAVALVSDPSLRLYAQQLRGRREALRGSVPEGQAILSSAARSAADADDPSAAALLMDACVAASLGGDLPGLEGLAPCARDLPSGGDTGLARALVSGVAGVLGRSGHAAASDLREAIGLCEQAGSQDHMAWAAMAAVWLGDDEAARGYALRTVARAREDGALDYLAVALAVLSDTDLAFSPPRAEIAATEGLALSRDLGESTFEAGHLATMATVAALRGDERWCVSYADRARDLAAIHGLGLPGARASAARALLDLGAGRPAEALTELEHLQASQPGTTHPLVAVRSVPDLVEAAQRSGQLARTDEALSRLEAWAAATEAPWVRAVLTRCLALSAQDSDADTHFETALQLHAQAGRPLEEARTALLYGELLRRSRRRADARPHLRAALQTFERMGAHPWAERARSELRATGETSRRRTDDTRDDLTPQERQIARAVAEGAATKEVARQLFISPRTVDYHLRKVFSKLGIASRSQLRDFDLSEGG